MNSIVVAALLLLIVAANATVSSVPVISRWIAYAGILIAATIGYLVPMQSLFFPNTWLKGLAALAVLCLPVYFAGIIFARSFAEVSFNSEACWFPTFQHREATVGGLLESFRRGLALRALLLVSVLLYALSALTLRSREQSFGCFAVLAANEGAANQLAIRGVTR